MYLLLLILWLFVLWTIFGSLGSVLLTRLSGWFIQKALKWIFFWFSQCPHCKHRLHAKNLIPLFSYFFQKWRCEYCHKPISTFYPTLEILSGLIFVLTYLAMGNGAWWMENVMFMLITNRLLLLLIIYDLQKYELHVPLRIITVAVSLISQFVFRVGNYGQAFYFSLLMGGICFLIYRWAKRYVKKHYQKDQEWFGEGDIMMWFLLGTLMPFVTIVNKISFSFWSVSELLILFFLLSSVLGIIGFGIKQWISTSSFFTLPRIKWLNFGLWYVPFIPFMVLAFWLLLFFGNFFISLFFAQW